MIYRHPQLQWLSDARPKTYGSFIVWVKKRFKRSNSEKEIEDMEDLHYDFWIHLLMVYIAERQKLMLMNSHGFIDDHFKELEDGANKNRIL